MFIAGDAAHSHPPYGGFGLNNGLEDVANLGWKLAAMLNGWGGDALLPSYSEERRPIFQETGEDFIAGAHPRRSRSSSTRYSPERDRAEFERAWKARESDVGDRVQTYEPNYEGSPVVLGPPGGVCSAHGTHTFKARAGHHLAPQPLSSGRNVFEELGAGLHAAGVRCRGRERCGRSSTRPPALGVPLKVVRDTYRGRTRGLRGARSSWCGRTSTSSGPATAAPPTRAH